MPVLREVCRICSAVYTGPQASTQIQQHLILAHGAKPAANGSYVVPGPKSPPPPPPPQVGVNPHQNITFVYTDWGKAQMKVDFIKRARATFGASKPDAFRLYEEKIDQFLMIYVLTSTNNYSIYKPTLNETYFNRCRLINIPLTPDLKDEDFVDTVVRAFK